MKPAGSGAEENKVYRGPVVIMSDAENYIGVRDPPRRKCESCCVCWRFPIVEGANLRVNIGGLFCVSFEQTAFLIELESLNEVRLSLC